MGEAVADFHIAASDFSLRRRNDLSIDGWRHLLEASLKSKGAVSPDLAAELTTELNTLENAWPVGLPTGIIHADLFPDNVFFERDRLTGMIDFYFACADYFAYELAICLNAWCFEEDGGFNISKARSLLRGYQRRRPLSDDELSALPILTRGAAFRFLMTRLHDWLNTPPNALVSPKNPMEYLGKLRFHRRVRGPEGYGLI